ncbi:MAG: amidoligase family protein [Myxococcales bacterium]|nr:amidoligase family protein [Myxococcales bacterium]
MTSEHLPHPRKIVALSVYVAALALAAWNAEALLAWLGDLPTHYGWLGYALVALGVAVGVALALPASALYVACGLAFGFGPGLGVALVGGALGSTVSFGFARWLRGQRPRRLDAVESRLGPLEEAVRTRGRSLLVWLRLSPFVPLSTVNVGAGLLRLRWRDFFLTLPASAAGALLFAGGGSLGERLANGRFGATEITALAILAASFVGLLFVGRAVRRELAAASSSKPTHPSVLRRPDTTLSPPLRPERRVGVEIELTGLDVDEATGCVMEVLGGRSRSSQTPLVRHVETELGDFEIERDSDPLKAAAARAERDELVLRDQFLLHVAEPWIPTEIVSPPLPIDALPELDRVCDALREAGAHGTRHSPLNALGLHLNPEVVGEDAATILATLRAFFLLRGFLRRDGAIDWSRRASPYIEPHSDAYVALVLDPEYDPDLDTLIEDYLEHEPSRNRELDLMPLFAHLRPERIARLNDPRIKARPTWHYRLPNCDLDDPEWSVTEEWQRWLLVERLASDPARLADWIDEWNRYGRVDRWLGAWVDEAERRIAS